MAAARPKIGAAKKSGSQQPLASQSVSSSRSSVAAAVCVLGKKNNPIFFRCKEEYAEKRMYFESLIFCSLDIVDECIERKAHVTSNYLGFLCPIDEYQVFGYMTSTHIKFMVILFDENMVQESDLRNFFAFAHKAYVAHSLNPFNPIDSDQISSRRFSNSIDKAVLTCLEKPAPSQQGGLPPTASSVGNHTNSASASSRAVPKQQISSAPPVAVSAALPVSGISPLNSSSLPRPQPPSSSSGVSAAVLPPPPS